jgi:tetratricopeptide (TPR) repeat protein
MKKLFLYIFLFSVFLFLSACSSRKALVSTGEEKQRTYPTTAVQKFAYGELYRQAGDFARALIEYEEAASIDSLSPVIYARIGETYMALNRMTKARNAFLKSVKLNPDQPGLYDMIALTLVMDGKTAEAEKIWLNLIENYPGYEDAWYNLSDFYFEQSDTAKGLDILQRLLKKDPANTDVLSRIVDVLHQLGRYEASIPYMEKLISQIPDYSFFYQSLYKTYIELGRMEEARETLLRWREQVNPSPQIELLYADQLIRNGEWRKALDILYQGHAVWPDQWAFPHLMAIVYIEKEEPDSVRKYYNMALNEGAAFPVAYRNYALWLADQGDIRTALDVILEGRDLYPDDQDLMYMEALLLDESDELVKAIQVLENLRTLQPDNENVLQMLAALYDRTGQSARAEELYEILLSKNGENPLILNNYSYLLAEHNKDLSKAWDMIQKALSLEPENGAYLDTAAWILYRLGRYPEALNYINRALSVLPDDSEMLYHKAMILLSMNQGSEASQLLQKSLKKNPDYKPARDQLEAMNHD